MDTTTRLNQPLWDKIHRLISESRFLRIGGLPNCNLEIDGLKFTIETIKDGSDPMLDSVLDLIEEPFTEDQMSDRETFRRKIDGITPLGDPRPQYRCFYVKNESGETIAARVAEQIPLKDLYGTTIEGKSIFYGIYIVVKKSYQKFGLARELYVSALIDFAMNSTLSIEFMIAECTSCSERLMNIAGLKRVYFQNGNIQRELRYKQPAMQFDRSAGNAMSGEPPAHFMICKLERTPLTKDDLKQSIISLYYQFQKAWPEELCANRTATDTYRDYYKSLTGGILDEIDTSGELIYLSKAERLENEQVGIMIDNYHDADI